MIRALVILIICCFINTQAHAAKRIVHLSIGYKTVHFAGKTRKAIVVNNQLPAPTLHFKEGDHIIIHVHNRLEKEAAIHWHGILVPWQMDGVLGISQKGIAPGRTFIYEFTLKQAGTYWYHAHAGLQEQEGLYGAFLIDPVVVPSYKYSKDFAMVLSDWSNTKAEQILSNLKKDGAYYSPRFPLQPSLFKFLHEYYENSHNARQELVNDYLGMQKTRMNIYDLSDVAYDAFLLNGHSRSKPWIRQVRVGDVVRLRFIGAAGSTIFQVKIPGSHMTMVHVQGNDVVPYDVDSFAIAPGETYDVLVKITQNKPYIVYAESRDTLGAAVGALITDVTQHVDVNAVEPFPEPMTASQEMMHMMMHGSHHQMHMTMPIEPSRHQDTFEAPTAHYKTSMGTKYEAMKAAVKTNNPNKPIESVINMELFGYMENFIWFINGTPEYNAHPIPLKPGKRYRLVFTNNSMMHHPMHIHGHWFMLRKGNGSYDPLLHTIDVPPGATITADVDTDASGQWFFHCHMLYHMLTGMSRVFQYSSLIEIVQGDAKPENIVTSTKYINRPIVRVDELRPIDRVLVKHPMAHPAGIWSANFIDVGADPFHNVQRFTYKGLFGPDFHKLELFTNDAEFSHGSIENADIDIFYWHQISQFWALKGGVNYFNAPAFHPYWQPGIGVEGLMPYFINTNARVYFYDSSVKLDLDLSRDTQLTNNFLVRTGVRSLLATKTVMNAAIGNGLNQMRYIVRPYYRVAPGLTAFVEYEYERDYGAFRQIAYTLGDSTNQNTVTLGLTAII